MSETVAIKEHDRLFDLYDADGCLVGKANPGKKAMLAGAFYVPERTCQADGDDPCRWRCTNCGAFVARNSVTDCVGVIPAAYCPNCGAKVTDE